MMKLELLLLCSALYYCLPVGFGCCSEQSGPQTQTHIGEDHGKHLKKRRNYEDLVSSEEKSHMQNILISSAQEEDSSSLMDVIPVTAQPNGSDPPQTASCRSADSEVSGLTDAPISDACATDCDGAPSNLQHDPHLSSISEITNTNPKRTGKGSNTLHLLKDQGGNMTPDRKVSLACKDQEEIPTFDEWTKIMMEVENEKSQSAHVSNSLHAVSKKPQQTFTNYASVECGAKILSSNPEAKSTSAILMENMDMYMLNPCNNKIWFIVELCQPIQVKQLDIANFEIFSSNPKDFLVSISDRYPTNRWLKLGKFQARDERTVQSFQLDEHLFAKYIKMFTKYIKVELLSHFGSEHFCPLSMVRVFGTSMMEEYELNSDPAGRQHFQDDHDDDQSPDFVPIDDKSSRNLIGSAKDALLTMVNNLAANVLGGNPKDYAKGERGNGSTEDLNVLLKQPVTLVVDVNETAVTTTITCKPTVEEVVPTLTASVSEDSTTVLHTEDIPVRTTPDVEPIVTLLPDEEESDESDRSLNTLEKHHLSSHVNVSESACPRAVSLQEYLLQLCSSQLSQKRTTKPISHSQAPIQLPHTKPFVSTTVIPSVLQHTMVSKEPMSSENSVSNVKILLVAETKSGFESGPLNLEPSLSSDFQKLSTDSLSFKVTHPFELGCLSVTECLMSKVPQESIDNLIESSENLPTSLSHITVSSTVKSCSDQVEGCGQISEQSSHEFDISACTNSANTVDQLQLVSLSTLVDHPIPKSSKNNMVTGASLTPTQPINPLDGSLGSTRSQESKSKEILDNAFLESDTNIEQPSSEIYTEMQNFSDVHGSNQKESVFMRLNNRIKVLEINMSLSGRYLEQLSQRYRKQVEEMQRAFNKTIIKLQNTSRIAEEQDQKQTDSIQTLQAQLENITRLVVSLSVSLSQLQEEVSDRQSYIVLCLILCVILGLLIYFKHHQMFCDGPPVQSEMSPSHERNVSYYYEDGIVRRRASDPLSQSSFQILDEAGAEESNSPKQWLHFPVNRKKKHQLKFNTSSEKLMSSVLTSPSAANGIPQCTAGPQGLHWTLLSAESAHLVTTDVMSDVSSEGSSQSDETLFCGISTCTRLCEALPAPNGLREKKSHKQRTTAGPLHQAPQCSGPTAGFGPTVNLHKN